MNIGHLFLAFICICICIYIYIYQIPQHDGVRLFEFFFYDVLVASLTSTVLWQPKVERP